MLAQGQPLNWQQFYVLILNHGSFLCRSGLLLRQRCHSQVWLDNLQLRPDLLRLLGLDARVDNDVVAGHPVDWGGDLVLVTGLERVDDPEDLGSVTAGRGRVGEDGADDLLGVDDEDGSDGEGDSLLIDVGRILVVDHVVPKGDLSVLVSNDGEVQVAAADLVDVLDPFAVAIDGVGGQADQLDASLCELGLQLGKGSQLSRAHYSSSV